MYWLLYVPFVCTVVVAGGLARFFEQHVPVHKYLTIFPVVCVNVFGIMPLVHILLDHSGLLIYTGGTGFGVLPALVLADGFVHVMHSMFHNRYLYRWFHYLHHQYRDPIGLDAFYLHGIDFLMTHCLPFYGAILLVDQHVWTLQLWTCGITAAGILLSHAGWGSNFHLVHHRNYRKNLGLGLVADRLLLTTE